MSALFISARMHPCAYVATIRPHAWQIKDGSNVTNIRSREKRTFKIVWGLLVPMAN